MKKYIADHLYSIKNISEEDFRLTPRIVEPSLSGKILDLLPVLFVVFIYILCVVTYFNYYF